MEADSQDSQIDRDASEPLVERLRGEAHLIRSIARAILHDAHLADDVVQDAYAKALAQPGGIPVVRSFVAALARNLALDRRRRELRRQTRELRVARPDIATNERSYRALTLAVLALDEPYRRTILARYFDDLSPRVIAAKEGAPIATVKSRLHRGLEQLREKLLDETGEYGGDRDAMLRGLAMLAAPRGILESLTVGSRSMSVTSIVLKTLAASIVIALATLTLRPAFFSAHSDAAVANAPPVAPVVTVASPPAPDPAPVNLVATREEVASSQTAPAATLATIRGRIELPSGAPAVGSKLKLHGFGANQERVIRFGRPKDWKDLEAITDADGRFEIRFSPPGAFQFALTAETEHESNLGWRWSSIDAGAVKDVKNARLPASGGVTGRVRNREGKLPAGHWLVQIWSRYKTQGDGGDATRMYVAPDATTGEFRFEAVPAGPAEMFASSIDRDGNKKSQEYEIDVTAAKILQQDIAYDAPDGESRRIRVDPVNRAVPEFVKLAAGSLQLVGKDGAKKVAVADPKRFDAWTFEEVEPGDYSLELNDPNFEPYRKTDVHPGQTIRIPVVGSSGVRLDVTRPDGSAIADYHAIARIQDPGIGSPKFEFRARDVPAPADSTYRGFVANTYLLTIEVEGSPPAHVRVADLKPSEIRKVAVTIHPGSLLKGRVLDGKETLAGVAIDLVDLVAMSPPSDLHDGNDEAIAHHRTRSDANGSFVLGPLPPGRYEIEAVRNREVRTAKTVIEIGANGSEGKDVTIDLSMPSSGRLRGRVQTKEGTPLALEGLSVAVSTGGRIDPFDDDVRAPLDASGRFAISPAPSGKCDVWLVLPPVTVPFLGDDWHFTEMAKCGVLPMHIGRAEVTAAQTDAEPTFTLEEPAPGALDVAVAIDGKPAAGFAALLYPAPDVTDGPSPLAAVVLDANGKGRLGPARPGVGDLLIQIGKNQVLAASVEPVRIASGTNSQRFDLVPQDAEIVFTRGASNTPLANWVPGIGLGVDLEHPSKTDAAGVLRTRLTPGRYFVSVQDPATTANAIPKVHSAELRWPAADRGRVVVHFD